MSVKKSKKFLIDNDLTAASMARTIARESGKSAASLRVMITKMINERDFYPSLASQLEAKFGLVITRPAHLKRLPNRQIA